MIRFLGALGVSILLTLLLHFHSAGYFLDQSVATIRYSDSSNQPNSEEMVHLAREVTNPIVLENVAKKLGLIQTDTSSEDRRVLLNQLEESLYVVIEKDSLLMELRARGESTRKAIALINLTAAEYFEYRKSLAGTPTTSKIEVVKLAREGKNHYPLGHFILLGGFFAFMFMLFYFIPDIFFHSTHHG